MNGVWVWMSEDDYVRICDLLMMRAGASVSMIVSKEYDDLLKRFKEGKR
jgi:hypothetical protein